MLVHHCIVLEGCPCCQWLLHAENVEAVHDLATTAGNYIKDQAIAKSVRQNGCDGSVRPRGQPRGTPEATCHTFASQRNVLQQPLLGSQSQQQQRLRQHWYQQEQQLQQQPQRSRSLSAQFKVTGCSRRPQRVRAMSAHLNSRQTGRALELAYARAKAQKYIREPASVTATTATQHEPLQTYVPSWTTRPPHIAFNLMSRAGSLGSIN